MSFDELPPESSLPDTRNAPSGEEPTADREASDTDAPPSAPARRRRAPRTGTDAASAETTNTTEPPARATRRRRKPVEEEKETGEEGVGEKTEDRRQKTEAASPIENRKSKIENSNAGSRRRNAKQIAPDTSVSAETPPADTPAVKENEPASSRRRSRRATEEAPTPAAETPAVAEAAASSPSSEDAAPLVSAANPDTPPALPEPTPARTSRRGSRVNAEGKREKGKGKREEQETGNREQGTEEAQAIIENRKSKIENPNASSAPDTLPTLEQLPPSVETPPSAIPNRQSKIENRKSKIENPEEDAPGSKRNRQRGGRTRRSSRVQTAPETSTETADSAENNNAESNVEIVAAPEIVAETNGELSTPPVTPPVSQRQNANVGKRRNNAVEVAGRKADTEAAGRKTDSDADMDNGADENEAARTPETRNRKRRNRRSNKGRRETQAVEAQAVSAAPVVVGETAVEPVLAQTPAPVVAVAEEVVEPIDLGVGTHLIVRNGVPQIHINGAAVAPVLFFGNMEGGKNAQRVLSEAKRAAKAGVHLHSTLIELPCPLSEAHYVLDEIDVRLRALLDADPDGYVMPRLVFVPARGWKREYPTEISVYNDGTNGDPSLTSERFWQECERALHTLIEHIQGQTYGERVFAYHLERGEWFQPADQGYDRSTANRDAFRDWLREKYNHSLILLRAAWYNGDVQFHTAEIPPTLGKPNPQRAFYETRRERSVIDFNEFTSETTANRLAQLARTVKKASHNNALVSVCYGYTLEFGHGFSGHLALNRLLASPHVDLICGPPSYRDRKPTGGASFPSPIDSPRLHGKLWLSEDDTKTYLAPAQQDPDDFNPRLNDRAATEQAHARATGRALATNTGVGWMDLWGEGWLDEEGFWERIGTFADRLAQQQRDMPAPARHDVVALIDEKSLLHIQKGEAFFRKLTNGVRDILQRAGISYGLYLQSDLLEKDFPTDARLYLFLTPFRLPAEHRAAIREKLQRDNKTLAWLYAPGACEERPSGGTGMEDVTTASVGLILRQQAWNSEVGSRILDPNHLLTERLGGRDIGARERLNPSFYIDDPGATVLAEYHGSGLPSIAVRSFGNWKSVFVGDPILPLELLRGLCRYAGVPVYVTGGEDVVSVGNGWITVHASRDGQRTLRLPAPQCIYDMHEQKLVGEDTRDYRYFLRMGMTRTFAIGTRQRFAAMGLPNLESPNRARPTGEREERGERNERDVTGRERETPGREREPSWRERNQPARQQDEPTLQEPALQTNRMPEESGIADAGGAEDEIAVRNDEMIVDNFITPAPTEPELAPTPRADTETPAPEPSLFDTAEPGLTPAPTPAPLLADLPEPLSLRAEPELQAPQEELELPPPPEDDDDLPSFEPFPQPRVEARTPLPTLATAPLSLRDDLATLKAVLEMEMPEEDGEDAATTSPAPLPIPREGLPGLEAVLGPDLSAIRRRRRRGGRGRGRKNGTDEPDTEEDETE